MDVFKCEVCGCRWRIGSMQIGDESAFLPLNDKQVPYDCCLTHSNLRPIEKLDPALYPTKRWDLDGAWQGLTAAIIGHAPTPWTRAFIELLPKPIKKVAVNQAISLVPDADLFVALDPHHPFWDRVKGFKGIKVLGVPHLVGTDYDLREHDPYYAGMMYERAGSIEIRNNFIAALRLVERLGVTNVLLLGVDAPAYDRRHAPTGFFGFTPVLASVVADLRRKGIEVDEEHV